MISSLKSLSGRQDIDIEWQNKLILHKALSHEVR